MSELTFSQKALEDYSYWQKQDKKTLLRINQLIKDIQCNPLTGIGNPEVLRGNLSGLMSRRINAKDRLIYKIDKNNIYIVACRGHYEK